MTRQPSFYIPHGGGPCFFMDDPAGTWTGMAAFLRGLPDRLPARPSAILIVSGHWETDGFAFTGAPNPPLVFDYYGFPPHTYELSYPAPGDPALADRAAALLQAAGLQAGVDAERGLDHGVFVPLKVAFPDADAPVVEMSLDTRLDPGLAWRAGRALRPLRDEGVLILGAGMSFHNMRAYRHAEATAPSVAFDDWLANAIEGDPAAREVALAGWADAPGGRFAHPREEHLLPLMVAAGASDGPGHRIYSEVVMETMISAFRFD
ncbi:DODA-type extradiol aromatic ring-opening family dioxygenase [Sphingomonas sp. SRS2]|uniref:DODA-type extradiol aromatic ring-opening family dioxygenase n=1 Tax=Sphingomonas sp. SRS2 TaxID=133190 RepID=UPI0006184DBB|nr:class III extradiol ring-cleavage dioxygenase [Sphingomonas sp. SRS2]KKC26515.1 aromatic ring-opening dioxygenase LigA [Sphingomonas sp. SRS2]